LGAFLGPDDGAAEAGLALIEWVIAVVLTMVALLFIANLAAMQYTAGAVRAAAAAGARSGAMFPASADDCLAAAEAVLRGESGLLRGPIGREAAVHCSVNADHVAVVVSARVPWFTGGAASVTIVGEERRHRALPP
jgi:hypothetical protein